MRLRLIWEDIDYEPGELKVVAYRDGAPADSAFVRTAGKPHRISLSYDGHALKSDGKDLAYVTVSILDKKGNLCPLDGSLLKFKVSGAGSYRAAANGDPTCLDIFHEPRMHAFNGKLTVIVQSSQTPGRIRLKVSGRRLRTAKLSVNSAL